MKTPSAARIFAPLLLAGGALAQLITTTLPYLDGDTLVVSVGTNALGVPITTQTIRTVTGTGLVTTPVGGAVTSALTSSSSSIARVTTPLVTSASTSRSSSSAVRTTAPVVAGQPTTSGTTQRVGQDTALPPPMRTTTYYYDTGNGYWTVATWTASVTRAPTVATVIPPAGTLQSYEQYQTSVNRNVLASAQASVSKAAGEMRASVGGFTEGSWVGWGIMGVGAVLGAGLAL